MISESSYIIKNEDVLNPSISQLKPPRDVEPLPLRTVTDKYDPSVTLEKLQSK